MFNIGGGEALVIALIALIVLGPQRLPGAARQAGKLMGDLRRVSSGFQNELKGALAEADAEDRATARRNPLAAEPLAPAVELEPTPPLAAAIQAVSDQSAAAPAAPAKKKAAAKKAPAKKTPTKKAAAKKASAKRAPAPARKTAAKKTPAKKPPAKKAAATTTSTRRTSGR